MTHVNSRLEAFCDGVFAIALTLLIIDLKAPHLPDNATSDEMWTALQGVLPSAFAFVLSFGMILITWVNHHEGLKQIDKSSMAFVYANGLLLFSVVLLPFPTSLLGDNLFNPNHAAPAVVLYSANHVLLAISWMLLSYTSRFPSPLTRSESGLAEARRAGISSVYAMLFYGLCAIAAAWYPLTVAGAITAVWFVWVIVYPLAIRSR